MIQDRFSPRSFAHLLLVFMVLSASSASGADTYWQSDSGDWFEAGNWSLGAPMATNRAMIYNGGTATINAPGAVADLLYLGTTADRSRLVIGAAGALQMERSLYVGYQGAAELELNGGSISQSVADQVLYVGFGASASGEVVHAGGTIDVGRIYCGESGSGTYTMNRGTLNITSTTEESRFGRLAGSTGIFTQNGGLLNVATRQLRIGENGNAYATMNGGTTRVAQAYAIIAYHREGIVNVDGGNLLVPNNHLYSGFGLTSTGRIVQTAGTVAVNRNLYNGYSGAAHYTLDGGTLTIGGECHIPFGYHNNPARGYFTQGGGTASLANVTIGNAASTFGSCTLSGGFMNLNSNYLTVGSAGTGTLTVTDGVITNVHYYRAGHSTGSTGTITQTGGKIYVSTSTQFGRAGCGSYAMRGGLLSLTDGAAEFWGGWGSSETGTFHFVHTGGILFKAQGGTERDFYIGRNAGSAVHYEIAGGTLDIGGSIIRMWATGSVFRVRGSASDITIGRFYSGYPTTALTEFILDKGTAHISAIHGLSTFCRISGTLRIGIEGGVVLARTNRFDLLDVANRTSGYDYDVKPPAEMWTCGWVDNQPPDNHDIYLATLATGAGSWHHGSIDLNGQNSLSFPASPTGSLTVLNLDTRDEYWGLCVRLEADPGSRTLDELVTYMQQAGYSNVAVEAAGSYDIVMYIDAADTKDGLTDGPSWFLWDLGGFDPAATIRAVMAYEHRPRGTSIMIR